jgi:hypothetical protein
MITIQKAATLNERNQVLNLEVSHGDGGGEFNICFELTAASDDGKTIYSSFAYINERYNGVDIDFESLDVMGALEDDENREELIEEIESALGSKLTEMITNSNEYKVKEQMRDLVIYLFGYQDQDDSLVRLDDSDCAETKFKEASLNRAADIIMEDCHPTYADALRRLFGGDKQRMAREMEVGERTLYRRLEEEISGWDMKAFLTLYNALD